MWKTLSNFLKYIYILFLENHPKIIDTELVYKTKLIYIQTIVRTWLSKEIPYAVNLTGLCNI